jgi:hypothetical protein
MSYKITRNDIDQWISTFQTTLSKINDSERTGELECPLRDLKNAIYDALYLVALVESLMILDEPDGVFERAKELQGRK